MLPPPSPEPDIYAEDAWNEIKNDNPGAEVTWSKYGFAERVAKVEIETGHSDVKDMESAARSFAYAQMDLFGLSDAEIEALVVRGKNDGQFEKTIPSIKFYQYKDGYRVSGGSFTAIFSRSGNVRGVYNETVPDLPDYAPATVTAEEAISNFFEFFDFPDADWKPKTDVFIRGHRDDRLVWRVWGRGYIAQIDAYTGEVDFAEEEEVEEYTGAKVNAYETQSDYDNGTADDLWIWYVDAKWWNGVFYYTIPFGKYFKIYDRLTLANDEIDTIESNAGGVYPYFNYADNDWRTAVGNTYYHLGNAAQAYVDWGFQSENQGEHELAVVVHHIARIGWPNGTNPHFNASGMANDGSMEYGSALNSAHDDWPVIALDIGYNYWGTTGGSRPPHVMKHEYNHWVSWSETDRGLVEAEEADLCANDWRALNEALAKFMGASMADVAPNNFEAAQFHCYNDEYHWDFEDNWFCCRAPSPNQVGNPDDTHDLCMSLVQGLWDARVAVDDRNPGDGKPFVNQSVYHAIANMEEVESCYTAAWKISDASFYLSLAWCEGIQNCPYIQYDNDIYNALYGHGYLRQSCFFNPETYTIGDNCDAPASTFCPRRDGSPTYPFPGWQCTNP
ncbi:hypothetical protein K8I61_05280 [bacterium]|nr:hypothetical protein [bacterium]